MELDPERQAFVNAVMKPLGDDEARRELLEKAVALAETLPPPANGDGLRGATDRMDSTARRFPLRHRIALAAVTAVALVVPWLTVAGPAARESLAGIWTGNLTTNLISDFCCSRTEVPTIPGIPKAEREHRFVRHLEKQVSPSDLALLAGDFRQERRSAQWKPVWDSHPKDPWHYYAYAIEFQREHKHWPDRFFYPVTLALIPVASVISKLADSWNPSEPWAAILVASLLAFPLLWLAMLAIGCFRHAPDRTLHRAALMIAARPFVAAAMMATVFTISWIHREEKHWTARAEFDAITSGHTVLVPRFEIDYGQWIAKETLRRLDEMEK